MLRRILLPGLLVAAVSFSLTVSAFAAPLPFTDVKPSDWYYSDVEKAYASGLINGRNENTFAPDANMTYAEAIKLAACMHQQYTQGSVTLVSGSTDWYSVYVDYAKENHIVSRDYSWTQTATRAGYVEIFAHALPDSGLTAKNDISDGAIPDVGMSHPQADSIYKMYRAGIIIGSDAKGTFNPDSNIKRSEVAAILTRMMDESARKELTLKTVPTNAPNDLDVYKPVLDQFRYYLQNGLYKDPNDSYPISKAGSYVNNAPLYMHAEDPYVPAICYSFADLNGDGTDELIMGTSDDYYPNKAFILDIFTLDDSQIVNIFDRKPSSYGFFERNTMTIYENGKLRHWGNGSLGTDVFTTYLYTSSQKSLVRIEILEDDWTSDPYIGTWSYYKITDSKGVSRDITQNEFNQYVAQYQAEPALKLDWHTLEV